MKEGKTGAAETDDAGIADPIAQLAGIQLS
jgi:hypothetical protein